jgi:hypothetical protein
MVDVYLSDPVRLRKNLPEIAQDLDEILSASEQQKGGTNPFGLTDRERGFYRESLDLILRKSKSQVLSTEEAIKGLEHAAALLIDNFLPGYPPRQDLLQLVRKATGIVPRKTGKPEEKIVRDGEPSRRVPVVRGIDLHLTWDLKLLRVSLDPSQWRLRGRALGFVGKGADVATDVAEHHDKYLAEVIENA